eukprot:CAMPEP_0119519056 /NCGR_PEP_ID=MMETSP1344-20130328/35484_1 /TAXON_ID=236787 /ORGANISM="Florenciella parvula, Strain CCMP2471" /LENGTH=79 /DNA_ID=CAMNT_0007556791 /DNA_START=75 /DNA_END=311 /DNA_ORIENTATION=+
MFKLHATSSIPQYVRASKVAIAPRIEGIILDEKAVGRVAMIVNRDSGESGRVVGVLLGHRSGNPLHAVERRPWYSGGFE